MRVNIHIILHIETVGTVSIRFPWFEEDIGEFNTNRVREMSFDSKAESGLLLRYLFYEGAPTNQQWASCQLKADTVPEL